MTKPSFRAINQTVVGLASGLALTHRWLTFVDGQVGGSIESVWLANADLATGQAVVIGTSFKPETSKIETSPNAAVGGQQVVSNAMLKLMNLTLPSSMSDSTRAHLLTSFNEFANQQADNWQQWPPVRFVLDQDELVGRVKQFSGSWLVYVPREEGDIAVLGHGVNPGGLAYVTLRAGHQYGFRFYEPIAMSDLVNPAGFGLRDIFVSSEKEADRDWLEVGASH